MLQTINRYCLGFPSLVSDARSLAFLPLEGATEYSANIKIFICPVGSFRFSSQNFDLSAFLTIQNNNHYPPKLKGARVWVLHLCSSGVIVGGGTVFMRERCGYNFV